MADDVVKVVFDLSVQTSNQEQLDRARKEINEIAFSQDRLNKQREQEAKFTAAQNAELKDRQEKYKALNKEEQALYENKRRATNQTIDFRREVEKTTQAQDKAGATTKRVYNEELGLIQKLNYQIQELKLRRERVQSGPTAKASIQDYTTQIKQLQGQVQQLEGTGANSSGLLGQIFGVQGAGAGRIGSQILQGALRGFAIGSGFGLITRLVDEVIKLGVEWNNVGEAEKKANKQIEDMIESLDKVNKKFEEEELGVKNLFPKEYVAQLKDELEVIKARGQVGTKVYEYEAKARDKEIEVSKENQKIKQNELDVLKQRAEILKGLEGLNPDINSTDSQRMFGKAFGSNPLAYALTEGIKTATRQQNGNLQAQDIDRILTDMQNKFHVSADYAKAIKNDLVDVTRLGGETGKFSTTAVIGAIGKLQEKARVELSEKQTELNSEKNKQLVIQTAFEANIEHQQTQLKLKMIDDIAKAEENYRLNKIKYAQQTFESLQKVNELELQEKLREIKKEEDLDRDKGILNAELTAMYSKRVEQITKESQNELLHAQREFLHKWQVNEMEFQLAMDKAGLTRISFGIGNSVDKGLSQSLAPYKEEANQKNKILIEELDKEYRVKVYKAKHEATLDDATRAKSLADIESWYDQEYNVVLQKQLDNELSIYEKHYKAVSEIIHKNLAIETAALQVAGSKAALQAGSKSIYLSPSARSSQIGIAQQKSAIDEMRAQQGATQNQLYSATATAADLRGQNAPEQKIKEAEAEVNRLTSQVDDLSLKIKNAQRDVTMAQGKMVADQIGQFADLVKAAVGAYQQIAAEHEKYIQVEAGIQQQRVEQANVIAQRGNTAALEQEQKKLNELQRQQELYARRQIAINTALQISNELLAIAKTVATYAGQPELLPILVPEVLAVLATSFAAATSLGSKYAAPAFAHGGHVKGPGDGKSDSIWARVSNGEFVTNAESTRKNRGLLEMINKGYDIPAIAKGIGATQGIGSTHDMKGLRKDVNRLIEAVEDNRTTVHANITRDGIYLAHKAVDRAERQKWT